MEQAGGFVYWDMAVKRKVSSETAKGCDAMTSASRLGCVSKGPRLNVFGVPAVASTGETGWEKIR